MSPRFVDADMEELEWHEPTPAEARLLLKFTYFYSYRPSSLHELQLNPLANFFAHLQSIAEG